MEPGDPRLLVNGLGWPEGPTIAPDGSVVFVESYRSQLSRWEPDQGEVQRRAYVAGAPNSCVHGSKGELYICQNGGTVGPWRAAEMTSPGIQRVNLDGAVTMLITSVDGIELNGPNDLVFGPDGHLYFTDPGTYAPDSPGPSRIFALAPDGQARLVHQFERPVFPNGIVAEPDGSILWDESYTGRVGRRKPNGSLEELCRLPGKNPIPDGMTVDAQGSIYVTDLAAGGIHVLTSSGSVTNFIPCGGAPTNCVFRDDTLYLTDAGVLANSSEPSFAGALWSVQANIHGSPPYFGTIGSPA